MTLQEAVAAYTEARLAWEETQARIDADTLLAQDLYREIATARATLDATLQSEVLETYETEKQRRADEMEPTGRR